jgi:DMSO/TMAO reductase YedYZ molybdopterin-dependent catalytic subunit
MKKDDKSTKSHLKQTEKGLHELYKEGPEKADMDIWGRIVNPVTRRGFLKKSGLIAMVAFVGSNIPFASLMPEGLIPADLAYATEPFSIPGKNGLVVLNDKPLNAESLPHFLDDDVTPSDRLFVRNNGIPPKNIDVKKWRLTIAGESIERATTFSIADLKRNFKHYTYQLQLECGGNGRSEFFPPAKGNQWSLGAVGCPTWTGVRLKDVLKSCGIKKNAVYTGYYGADTHLSGNPKKDPISRGVPLAKALENESLIVWAMNDKDIPLNNGHPLRVITAGWPGSTCGKWLEKLVLRDKVHDGTKMTGMAYRTPCNPVASGEFVDKKDMCTIESMPVKSLITFPESGKKMKIGQQLTVRGSAWAGDLSVKSLHVSIDFGATWVKCKLKRPANRLSWQRWETKLSFPKTGYYEVWARATDAKGTTQPMVVPGWNPKGYLNNACHRIAVRVV